MIRARKLALILIGMITLGGTVAYITTQLTATSPGTIYRHIPWLIFALMTALSSALILLIWSSHNRALKSVLDQLDRFERTNRIGLIMADAHDDLAHLIKAINRYLTRIKYTFEMDRQQHKELQLQADVAETERLQAQAVIFSISQAVMVTDKNDELILANQSAQNLFQFSAELNYRMAIDQVIDDQQIIQLIRDARLNNNNQATRQLQRTDPLTDKPLTLKALASCVLDDKLQPLGVVVVIDDITADNEIARMKDDLVNSVSHELKTPLASIQAYAEMLAEGEAQNAETHKEFCAVIQDQAQRLNHLIDDILNISRIESGLLKVSKRPVNLNELITETIAAINPQAQLKEIELIDDLYPRDILISAERDMIFRSILNLLSNAIKYSPPKSRVLIRTRTDRNDNAVIIVQDNGIGIPHDCIDRVFDKFYRVPDHDKQTSGTGLGLNLAQQVIKNVHNGTITVKSQPGQGTTFTVSLPAIKKTQYVN